VLGVFGGGGVPGSQLITDISNNPYLSQLIELKIQEIMRTRNEATKAETSENLNQPGASGGRPVGSIKSAAISFPESSH
jgi:hypothetical protein